MKVRPAMGKVKAYFYAGTSWAAVEPGKSVSEGAFIPAPYDHDEQSFRAQPKPLYYTAEILLLLRQDHPDWQECWWLGKQGHQVLLVGAHAGTIWEENLTTC